jgi:hypothetical protein
LSDLIQVAFDLITDSVNEVEEKLKSKKFIRKLKVCVLASLTDMYDNRSTTTEKEEKYRFINQSLLLQLKYGMYLETDL